MAESVTLKLKELRERAQMSMQALALAIGFRTASSYQRYEDPALFKKDELPLHIIRKLLDVLPGKGNPPITREEIMMLSGLNNLSAPQLESIDNQDWILCVGEAAIGVWKEKAEWPTDRNEPLAIATRDRRYPSARRRALLVKDDSIDELYTPGSYVIFILMSDVGRAPKANEKVIVHRKRHGLVEVSVRVVSVDPSGKIWLNAKSSNPAHYAIPAQSQSDDGTTVEIAGLVVGSQTIE